MKKIINVPGFVKVIINILVRHHGLSNSIITDWGLLFTSNFGFCYFISWESSKNSLWLSILRPIAKPKEKMSQLRHILELLWTGSKMIGYASCQ